MKKIFYLFLLMMNLTVFGQNTPTIHPLNGGFTFLGEKLENHTQVFNATTPKDCGFQFSNSYKYYSFQAGFDMSFAFDLIATKPDFNFIIWKLDKDKNPTSIFDKGGTIAADRSVYDKNLLTKGMKDGETEKCEYQNGNGYVNSLNGIEALKKGETVVIAIYGLNNTDLFDIKVNVAEERMINKFNYLCAGSPYAYNLIYDEIVTDSGLSDIKLFSDNSFVNEIPSDAIFNSDQIVYAQVKDATGALKYIYTIPISFIPDHIFPYKSTIDPIYECTLSYKLESEKLLNIIFETVNADYKIKTLEVDGISYAIGDVLNLAVGEIKNIDVVVTYDNSCPLDSKEITIQLQQGSPILSDDINENTCENEYIVNFNNIYTKLSVDKSQFDLIILYNGKPVSDGDKIVILNTLNFTVKIKSKTTGGCESNSVNFIVTKTSAANIVDTLIDNLCVIDFTSSILDTKIDEILNGTTSVLRFYKSDGITNLLDRNEVYNYILENKKGEVIVKALQIDNANICDTSKKLTFNLSESSFILNTTIKDLLSTCSSVGSGYIFTQNEIEAYLKTELNRSDIIFDGIKEEILGDNESKIINFKVKINGELCWSEEMTFNLRVITKPDVDDATNSLQADCNDYVFIDQSILQSLFGSTSTTLYDYEILEDITKPLIFVAGESKVTIRFKNKYNNSCFIDKVITVIQSKNLNIDITSIEQDAAQNPYNFCNPIISSELEDYILGYISQVQALYTNVVAEKSAFQYAQEMIDNNGMIAIKFLDPNLCGVKELILKYEAYPVEVIDIAPQVIICTGYYYSLDLSIYNIVRVYDASGTLLVGNNNIYELNLGSYNIEVENEYGCVTKKQFEVVTGEEPIIKEIILNADSIEVIVEGNKTSLEYSLDGKNWQKINKFIGIQKGISYTVFVRKDGCTVISIPNIVYLNIPNYITPNGDGINDIWRPIGAQNTLDLSVKILNRSGKLIYEAQGPDALNWDGKYNNKPLASDSYWYFIEYVDKKAIIKLKYQGYITIKSNFK